MRRRRSARRPLTAGLLIAAVSGATLAACGGGPEPGNAAPEPPPPPPDLTGAAVMLFPVQLPAPDGLDSAITAQVRERLPRTEWIGREALQSAIDRTPPWRLRLDALPPGIAVFADERYVSDPLYGHLRRLSGLLNARMALLPFGATEVTDTAGTAVQITAALLDSMGGRVLWLGAVRGDPVPAGAPPDVRSAAEALARALVP